MSIPVQHGLSGVWEGLFSYPRSYKPTPFTAVILEFGGTIGGTIHEICNNGRLKGKALNATIAGSWRGSAVQFVKTYDPGTEYHSRPISYDGTLSSGATEIEGSWIVPASWSGKFLLIRTSRQRDGAIAQQRQTAPAD